MRGTTVLVLASFILPIFAIPLPNNEIISRNSDTSSLGVTEELQRRSRIALVGNANTRDLLERTPIIEAIPVSARSGTTIRDEDEADEIDSPDVDDEDDEEGLLEETEVSEHLDDPEKGGIRGHGSNPRGVDKRGHSDRGASNGKRGRVYGGGHKVRRGRVSGGGHKSKRGRVSGGGHKSKRGRVSGGGHKSRRGRVQGGGHKRGLVERAVNFFFH